MHQQLLSNFLSFTANDNAPALDMSDFPVLANRGRQTEAANSNMNMFQPNPMAGRPAYGKVASLNTVGPFSGAIKSHSSLHVAF